MIRALGAAFGQVGLIGWCWVAFGTVVFMVGAWDLAAIVGLLPWLPMHVHQTLVSFAVALMVLCLLSRHLPATIDALLRKHGNPAAEAYRIGLAQGARQQRNHCAHECGHTCSVDVTGDMPAIYAAGGGANVLPIRPGRTSSNSYR